MSIEEQKYFAAVFFLQNEKGQVLAVSRKDNSSDFGLPGGKVDPGESSLRAAIRELEEETGLCVDPAHVHYIYERDAGEGKKVACYTANVNNLSGTILSTEAGVVEWVEPIILTQGSFGEYNKGLFNTLGVKYA